MSNPAAIVQDVAAGAMRRALGLFVGQGRAHSIDAVAAATEIPERTLRSYQAGEATPGLANLYRIKAVLPPAFANELLALSGLGGARRLDSSAKAAAIVMTELATETALFAKALQDGRLDHIERAELRRTLPALIEDLTNLQAALAKEAA